MNIIPAIDIKNSKCVRLFQGDYNRETIYSDSPKEIAQEWVSLGAKWLHVVDLDGAKSGNLDNIQTVKEILLETNVSIQFGGGVRDINSAQKIVNSGVSRIILGTAAVEDHYFVEEACHRFGPDAVVVSLDAKNGVIAKNGWTQESSISAIDLATKLIRLGVKRFMYTDIERDGTLTSPNYSEIEKIVDFTQLPILAAGGVSKLEHLEELETIGAESVIIGTAIYEGKIDLKEAICRFEKN